MAVATPWKQGRYRPSPCSHSWSGTRGGSSNCSTTAKALSATTATDAPSVLPAGTDVRAPSGSDPAGALSAPRNVNGAPVATRMATDAGPGAHGSASVRTSSAVSVNGAPGFPASCSSSNRARPENSPSGNSAKALPSKRSDLSAAKPSNVAAGSAASALSDKSSHSKPPRPRSAAAGNSARPLPESRSSKSAGCGPSTAGRDWMRLPSSRSDMSSGSAPNGSAGHAVSRLSDRSRSRRRSSCSKSSTCSRASPAAGKRSAVWRDRSATAAQGRPLRRASRTAAVRSHTPSSITATALVFIPSP